ncbi:S-adenosyl-L-methionine-dependent methyltransferase [Infundibulicybe gibba]|nr:S-adenosyl-L-methionine-dependent methyltransferase [Infundibulicybe gibba]
MSDPTLSSLANLISASIAAIERNCVARKVKLPSLDEPFTPQSEAPLLDPEVQNAAAIVIAAAAQLTATLRLAPVTLITTAVQFHVSSALRVAADTNVIEILREAGPQGLHVDEIAKKNGTNPAKLARLLRLLASEHIFREVSPDVFTNNRISSALDTGKPVSELFAKPDDKYAGTSSLAACVSHFTDEAFKSSAYLKEAMTDPCYANAEDPTHAAFNKAYNTNLPLFTWYEQPGHEARLSRFGMVFEGASRMFPNEAILQGYDWSGLEEGSLMVDIGGGIGSQAMLIAKTFPDVQIIVQDRPPIIEDGLKNFNNQLPDALKSGQVSFQGHDFLEAQPVTNAKLYFMRMILHDWSDSACIKILKNLRASATPDTELLVVEEVMSYACRDTSILNVPGASGNPPPEPLLANLGHAMIFEYMIDTQMMSLLNGQERTLAQFSHLFDVSGWKLNRVRRSPIAAAMHQYIVAVPAY